MGVSGRPYPQSAARNKSAESGLPSDAVLRLIDNTYRRMAEDYTARDFSSHSRRNMSGLSPP